MPQAIVDPEELRHFAANLKKFNADVQERLTSLAGQLTALGRSWRDQEHKKFAEEFSQTLKALKRFVDISNQHTPFLLRKAQRIEEYLNQK